MRLEFHREITADISRIMNYYEDVAGQQLADEFYAELRTFFQKAADSPENLQRSRSRPETRGPREISLSFFVPHRRRANRAHFGCSSPQAPTIARASPTLKS